MYKYLYKVEFYTKERGKFRTYYTDYKLDVIEAIKDDLFNFAYVYYRDVGLGVAAFLEMFKDFYVFI